jgi:hypothetical protein
MKPVVRIQTDKTHVRSHPLRDEIHDEGLNLEAFLADGAPRPDDRGRGPQPHKVTR